MQVRWIDGRIGLRKSTTRIPFRYGKTCLVHCPQAVARVEVEVNGSRAIGFSGDCLPPGWFDKSPDKSYPQQLDDMIMTISRAKNDFKDRLIDPQPFFGVWLELQQQIPQSCASDGMVPLLESFGISIWERAILDAACRAAGTPFFQAVRNNLFGIDAGSAHPELAGCDPSSWLPQSPANRIAVRHTIGMGDPLTVMDVPSTERLDDGRPQTLEDYLKTSGIRYVKVKVSGDIAADHQRITAVAGIVETHCGSDYGVTVDGNEQFSSLAHLSEFLDVIRSDSRLKSFWNNILAFEQPLPRQLALDTPIQSLHPSLDDKPVIIDESDGTLDAFSRAVGLGYGGVSSKNCKGAQRAILNAGLVWKHNRNTELAPQIVTGEDLCSVGVIPVQADLCLAATLGLTHIERNGHHFHPGLAYLPTASQQAALKAHPDFYTEIRGTVSPIVNDGEFSIASLHRCGFGFDWNPDFDDWPAPEHWSWDEFLS